MKTIQKYMNLDSKQDLALKQEYMNSFQDPKFREYIETLPISENILIHYTSRLKEASEEFHHCKNCKGLAFCQNKIKGYLLMARQEYKTINFSYVACHYEQEKNQTLTYQTYLSYYEMSEEMKKASMQRVYKDDKKRIPIIKYFTEFIKQYEKDESPRGMYLYGSFGSGKTYLIAALLNELAKRHARSAVVYFPEFLRHLKASFHEDFEEKFQSIKKAPILLLDDIGAENLTAWSRDEILGPILQYRMEQNLPTFFTSNLNLEELESHLSMTTSGVDKVKARRIIERIKQLTTSFELISENRRK